ncbi:hypothetical protein [Micromonospora sp. NPDC049497]|uniref:hypothetical protein n=1 Tax=Micromonospora sp. NPDC049497 TaxID=3364273 RepID=UPI0037A8A589
MPSVASSHPLWGITLRSLRDLTRLAVTAVALAVGLGGTTATVAAPPPAPVVHVASVVHVAPAVHVAAVPSVAAARVEPMGAVPAGYVTAPPAAGPSVPTAGDLRAVATVTDAPADEPGRDALTRRGPPRA